jgi:hypothetical protein
MLVFTAPLLPFLQNVRPQMFTYLLFTVFLLLIYRAEQGEYRWLWVLPPLAILWANLHGGFLAAIGILLGWAAVHLVLHRDAWRKVLPPTLLTALAVNINPYGRELLFFLLRTATVPRPEIEDWQPIRLFSAYGAAYLIVLALAIAGIALTRRQRAPALMAILLVTAILPLTAIRHIPLFCLAALIVAGEHIADAWERFAPTHQRSQPQRPALASIPLLGLVALFGLAYSLDLGHVHVKEGEYPFQAMTLLRESGVSGNLANEFNWGEYLIWHLGPRIKVSVDGRRETVYPPSIYQENADFMDATKRWNLLLQQHPTDLALVMRDHTIYRLLKQDPDWSLMYEDSVSALFAAKDSPALSPLRDFVTNFKPATEADRFP